MKTDGVRRTLLIDPSIDRRNDKTYSHITAHRLLYDYSPYAPLSRLHYPSQARKHAFPVWAEITHLHKLRARQLEENGVGLFGAGSREKRLSRPGRPVQQDTLRGADANVVEHVLVGHGQHDGLDQLLDFFVQA